MALAETMWPEEFLSTPDRKEEEEKLVAVRNIPLVWVGRRRRKRRKRRGERC